MDVFDRRNIIINVIAGHRLKYGYLKKFSDRARSGANLPK